jgi:Recombinase.
MVHSKELPGRKDVTQSGPVFGYTPDKNRNPVIKPDEADIVRLIFKRYLSGISGFQIAKDFNEEKYRLNLKGFGPRKESFGLSQMKSIWGIAFFKNRLLMRKETRKGIKDKK